MPGRRAFRRIAIIGAIGIVLWSAFVLFAIVRGSAQASGARADALIVLGAGVDGDRPSPVLEGRLEHALQLFRDGRAKTVILTGAKGEGDTLSEAAAGQRYLVARGVPAVAILIEETSRTTRENLHEARILLREARAQDALLVSDPLHLLRARLIAQDLDMTVTGSPTPHSRYRGFWSQTRFALRELVFLHVHWLAGK